MLCSVLELRDDIPAIEEGWMILLVLTNSWYSMYRSEELIIITNLKCVNHFKEKAQAINVVYTFGSPEIDLKM